VSDRRPSGGDAAPLGAPIHRSLAEPILLGGMERKPALTLFIAAAVVALGAGLHWYTLACAALLLTVGPYGLGKLAAYDPQLEDVLRRYASYQYVYDAEAPVGLRKPFFGSSRALPAPKRPAVPSVKEIP
jgi:type IV secretory pathway TrbD component